jgi:hypothetical protein
LIVAEVAKSCGCRIKPKVLAASATLSGFAFIFSQPLCVRVCRHTECAYYFACAEFLDRGPTVGKTLGPGGKLQKAHLLDVRVPVNTVAAAHRPRSLRCVLAFSGLLAITSFHTVPASETKVYGVDEKPADKDSDPAMHPFVQLWASYMQQVGDAAKKMQQSSSSGVDLREWQRRWLEAAKKNTDAYLRSAPFLQAMKRNMDSLRPGEDTAPDDRGSADADERASTASPEISEVLKRLRSIDELVKQRLAVIERRLEDIEARLPDDAVPPDDQTSRNA